MGGTSPFKLQRSLIFPSFYDTPSVTSSLSSSLSFTTNQKKAWKEEFAKALIKWEDIGVSFEEFPYHVNQETKDMLINSAFLFLKKPEYVKFTSDLSTVSRKILLSGPPGMFRALLSPLSPPPVDLTLNKFAFPL